MYDQIQSSVSYLSDYFATPHGVIYDLGCATGETILQIEKRHPHKQLHFVGVDESKDMLDKAIEKNADNHRAVFRQQSIQECTFEFKSHLVLSILTLQFLPIHERRELLINVFNALHEGGALVLVEKTMSATPAIQHVFTHIQYDIKLESGLSYEEIFRKEEALRGVMNPISVEDNLKLLQEAGFHTDIFLKHWQFTGFLAIKPIL